MIYVIGIGFFVVAVLLSYSQVKKESKQMWSSNKKEEE